MKANKPNIVLLTIDCLRADHLGCMGYKCQTTPFIDKLAKKGVLFKAAYSNGPGTTFAFKSIFCSAYPTQITGLGLPSDYPPTLAELLKPHGYSTAGFNTNGYLSRSFHYNRGFDVFYDVDAWRDSFFERMRIRTERLLNDCAGLRASRMVGDSLFRQKQMPRLWKYYKSGFPHLFADELTQKALRWMKRQSNHFFTWIHFMDAHHPYFVRVKSKIRMKRNKRFREFNEDEVNELVKLYDDQISHVDKVIQTLLEEYQRFARRETIFIITSDHGEEFKEHGSFHRPSPYQEMIHIPMIIVGSPIPEGTKINAPVSHIDLLPTIMDMLGHGAASWMEGKSLLSSLKKTSIEETIFINYGEQKKEVRAVLQNQKKLIFKKENDSWEFYDMVLDPYEKNNVFQEDDIEQQKMRKKMDETVHHIKSKAAYLAKEAKVSRHISDQLRALGYL